MDESNVFEQLPVSSRLSNPLKVILWFDSIRIQCCQYIPLVHLCCDSVVISASVLVRCRELKSCVVLITNRLSTAATALLLIAIAFLSPFLTFTNASSHWSVHSTLIQRHSCKPNMRTSAHTQPTVVQPYSRRRTTATRLQGVLQGLQPPKPWTLHLAWHEWQSRGFSLRTEP